MVASAETISALWGTHYPTDRFEWILFLCQLSWNDRYLRIPAGLSRREADIRRWQSSRLGRKSIRAAPDDVYVAALGVLSYS
jgi:hypothetical protein